MSFVLLTSWLAQSLSNQYFSQTILYLRGEIVVLRSHSMMNRRRQVPKAHTRRIIAVWYGRLLSFVGFSFSYLSIGSCSCSIWFIYELGCAAFSFLSVSLTIEAIVLMKVFLFMLILDADDVFESSKSKRLTSGLLLVYTESPKGSDFRNF